MTVAAWDPFSNLIDPLEYLRDGRGASYFGDLAQGATRAALPTDFADGDNSPAWTSETAHATIRGRCRSLAEADEIALGARGTLVDFTIGDGFKIEWVPKRKGDSGMVAAAAEVQAWWDALGPDLVGEQFQRSVFADAITDGEALIAIEQRGLVVEPRRVEPSFLTEPSQTRALEDYAGIGTGLSWKYGVATETNRTDRPLGYFVSWYGDRNDWELYTPDRFVHHRRNVSPLVKRGLSDYSAAFTMLDKSGRLTLNAVWGTAIMAAIAYVREHPEGTTRDAMVDLVRQRADAMLDARTGSGGRRTEGLRYARPGTVADVGAGFKYHAGPLSESNGSTAVPILQAALRRVGTRWQMPEYMISGDASNANYSSTLVAESPFIRASEARQRVFASVLRELAWKMLGAIVAKRFNRKAEQLAALVECKITPPNIALRNKREAHEINKSQFAHGLLSIETWAAEEGRDLEQEQARGAALQPTLAGSIGHAPAMIAPTTPTPAPTPLGGDVQATALNGAQVQSLLTIVQAAAARQLPIEAARGMIAAAFPALDPPAVDAILRPLGSFVPPPAPEPAPTPTNPRESWAGYP